MPATTPRRGPRVFAVLLAMALLSSCGVERGGGDAVLAGGGDIGATGTPIETTEPVVDADDLLPPVDLPVTGKTDSPLNLVATTAIADLEEWWGEQYPELFGEEYLPLSGGLYAYGADTDPLTVPCVGDDISIALFNAFYCGTADIVAWDQEQLFPYFADNYGEFAVAVVLAHEWGHVIQSPDRSDMRGATITEELQADCYAGAWVRHARDADRPYFAVDTATLDEAVAGILRLRDQPGSAPDAPNAHGSGFDRVRAFQDGYQSGLESCVDYSDTTIAPYQFPFLDEDDFHNEGDMPLEEIKGLAVESLEAYWSDVFPELSGGEEWPGLDAREFPEGDPLQCGDDRVDGYRLFLCWPDRYVGYSSEAADAAYDTGIGGDFAVAALLATQYGLAVQIALGDDLTEDPVAATLRGDCYAGAWGAALIEGADAPVPEEWVLRLSPGDLDEGIAVLLSFRTESDRQRQGPGFDRVTAFRGGVLEGPEFCRNLTPGEE